MRSLFASGWIVPIAGVLVLGLNVALNRLKGRGRPAWEIRAVQAALVLLSALMIYSVYLQYTG